MSVLPADTFIVVNKTTLSDKDRNLLMLLYQPIVGSISISLYYTLWSYLDKSEILSNEWTHHHILRDMMISNSEFVEAKDGDVYINGKKIDDNDLDYIENCIRVDVDDDKQHNTIIKKTHDAYVFRCYDSEENEFFDKIIPGGYSIGNYKG